MECFILEMWINRIDVHHYGLKNLKEIAINDFFVFGLNSQTIIYEIMIHNLIEILFYF
jgi:hypothetical protein